MSYPNGGYDQNNGGNAPYGNDPYGQGSANQPGYPGSQGSANTYGQYPGSQGSANSYGGQYPDSQGSANSYNQYPGSQGSANTYGQQGGGYGQADPYGQQQGGYGQPQDPYGQQPGQPQDPYGQQSGYQAGGAYPEPSGMAGQYGATPYGAGPYGANQRPQVSFAQAIKLGFKNYVNFYGRASKSEFWYWILFYVIVSLVVGIIGGVINSAMGFDATSATLGSGGTNPAGVLNGIVTLGLILPWVSLGVRRMHDTNRSGGFVALQLIPLVGWIIVLVLGNGESNPEGARFDNPDGSQPALP